MSAFMQVSGNVILNTGQVGDSQLTMALASLFNSASVLIEPALAVGTSPITVTLPGSPVKGVYIQNNHATQTLTIVWTRNGGTADQDVYVLQPGEFILIGGQSGASGGLTSLKLNGSGAGTTTKLALAA